MTDTDQVVSSRRTRAERLRSRLEDHPVGAVAVVAVSAIAAVGIVLGAFRDAVDLLDGSPAPERKPVTFAPDELERAENSRFGFSFEYPDTWRRTDPTNGDGASAAGPVPGLELSAFGSWVSSGPTDVLDRLEYRVGETLRYEEAEMVEDPEQQNVTWEQAGGGQIQLNGSRYTVATEASVDTATDEVIITILTTTTGDRDVEIRCQVPTSLYPEYEGACNQLVETLELSEPEELIAPP